LNSTSLESTPSEPSVAPNCADEYNPPCVSVDDDCDDEVSIIQPLDHGGAATTSKRPATVRRGKEPIAVSRGKELAAVDGGKKLGKRQKKDAAMDKLEKYLELRTKQVEGEAVEQARDAAVADDFSINKCISILNTMEGLSGEQKAEAFDIFKDVQNREIFVAAEPTSTHYMAA